ncbi:lipopolysaccharide biosynthesis protein [Sphingobacterium psychroaquaticum]|uniref:Na+-driven multidrug efflux pump n=1 Tax=Sphingobacterium psychroaquaticum TaxID=561061 RepID=A0A1X7L2Q9_9SPHI|nr:oligosaccharide flippase family protein [Sphingobacterium psychroaquaticum]QBQ39820.1 lipopolysaccharide biosynthesis protein [Sphingobacterium psychroaquaticum]SMG47492.1 Na+-driven multidrug efflux pump [Sphingobacterium psychroaquaticum]
MSEQRNDGSAKIVKNTLILSSRIFVTLGISLYTSRIMLEVLGVVDFGIFNIVGGIVVLFTFLNAAMSATTQRFFSFNIGRRDENQVNQVFSCSILIHIGIALIVFLLAETVGLWFVNNKLNLPSNRIDTINWVYQFSIISCMLTVFQVPFTALIIAYERMNIFAILSVFEALLRLLFILIISKVEGDKLKMHALSICLITVLITAIYWGYTRLKIRDVRLKFPIEKLQFRKLVSYSGWSLFGNLASTAKGQGINVLLNLVFGVTVNASYAIMMQVQNAINSFVNNFQLALNPQIVKSFAVKDLSRTSQLVFIGIKISFSVMLCLVAPILLYLDDILIIWLKTPPHYAALFIRLCLINMLLDSLSGPLMIGIQASDKIKTYQICVGLLMLLNLPVSYILLKLFELPEITFYVSICISFIALFLRVYFFKRNTGIKVERFFFDILPRLTAGVLATICFVKVLGNFLLSFENIYIWGINVVLLDIAIVFIIILVVLNPLERKTVFQFFRSKLQFSIK